MSSFYAELVPAHSGVTGSCFVLTVNFPNRTKFSVAIDCGMFQGKDDAMNYDTPLLSGAKTADALFLTHNHVDHTGRVPELVREGFRGKIYTSNATFGLLDKAWFDCEKVERGNAAKAGRYPRFKKLHVTKALRQVRVLRNRARARIHPNVWVTLFKNGHVFGSSMILFEISEREFEEPSLRFLFTGDYSSKNRFFTVNDLPEDVKNMPLHIICEATYGENARQGSREPLFEKNILKGISVGSDILIPVFAFERGQVILSILKELQQSGKLNKNVPIFMDGKLFKAYTSHYMKVARAYFDKVTKYDFLPANATWVKSKKQRLEILSKGSQKIIVASGGMASFGASQAYLPSFISNPNGIIHFTGYQCEGTLGRKLQVANETNSPLTFGGKVTRVDCKMLFTEEFSSHASRDELLEFIRGFKHKRSILLNHGSYEAKKEMAEAIVTNFIADEVAIAERRVRYRYTPYKLEKIIRGANVS